MNYIFENIQFNSEIPIKIFVHNLNYMQNHWHEALEILFVLDGSIHIGIGNSVYQLDKDDLIVINPNEIHTTNSKSFNLVLALQVPKEWINRYTSFQNVQLSCNSSIGIESYHMDEIRKLLAQMLWVNNNQSIGFELRLQGYLYELLYKLFTHFQVENQLKIPIESEKYMPRLSNIIHYIHENYDKDISLSALSEKEYLSVSYTSRFFKRHIGTSFKEYVVRIRLEHAVKDLLYSDKSIIQLSLDNGFPSTKSFLDAFKETYNEAPSIYRKKAKEDYQFLYGPNLKSNNYFDITNLDLFASLYRYLDFDLKQSADTSSSGSVKINLGEIDLSQEATPILHTWKNLITIGKAKDVLLDELQEQLSMLHRDIGFRYLRFHGIFDDEMMIYSEDALGNPTLNYTYVDELVDFLYSIDMKPFFELGFMPKQLAKTQKTIFHKPSIISMPRDNQKWSYLVQSFILHCLDRYGKEEVEQWYFEFWNEPEFTGYFWNDSEDDYLSFYAQTYRTIKAISKNILIGGPTVCVSSNMYEWLERYFTFCKNEKCLPDFFTFHFYPHQVTTDVFYNILLSGQDRFILSHDIDFLKSSIQQIKDYTSQYNYSSTQIHMTEWNSSSSHRDLTHDTLYMSSYIVKNVLENMDSIGSFGYWTMSDFIEELPLPKSSFHGGLGLITFNGIKKAGYYAFKLLNHLGANKISSGTGYYITSDSRGYQILLYNYCHFDPLYCSMDHSGISPTDRYNVYKDNFNRTIQITLRGLKESTYRIKEYTVSRTNGSSYDTWVNMGAPEIMEPDEIQYLKDKSVPHYQKSYEVINDVYTIQRCLSPHSICLIEIDNT